MRWRQLFWFIYVGFLAFIILYGVFSYLTPHAEVQTQESFTPPPPDQSPLALDNDSISTMPPGINDSFAAIYHNWGVCDA